MRQDPIAVGSQRQLFLDDLFFASRNNVSLTMHTPRLQEVALVRDRPWESRSLDCPCVLEDGGRYRMWYRADEGVQHVSQEDRANVCYAESGDGIHWEKPNLGLVEWGGSRDNNLVFPVEGIDGTRVKNASVIIDPNASAAERYKMIARTVGGRKTTICGYVSDDGLSWRPVETNPLLTEGPFDSHNIVIWDDERERFVIYMRGVDRSVPGPFSSGRRAIRRSESEDFRDWTKPEMALAADQDDPVDLHLYTNAAVKYHRAARAYLMFPMTLYQERVYPTAPFPGLSDVVFAISRDGVKWDRPFRRPFIPPGLDERNWVDRNPMMGAGIFETGQSEISMISQELLKSDDSRFRRCSLRTDGFVSISAPYMGWSEFTTHPLTFDGSALELNYSTSGGGSILVEVQDGSGDPIPGLALDDCVEVFGDKVDGTVRWKGDAGLGTLSGKPVRLRVRMRDADLYAFRFRN